MVQIDCIYVLIIIKGECSLCMLLEHYQYYLSSLTQADIVFILQATSVPDRLLLLLLFNTLLLDPAQMKIGSTGLEDI